MKLWVPVVLSVFLVLPAVPHPAAAQTTGWQPPIGIPAPSFGIVQTAPPAPSPWNVPVANYFYVDATAGGATDEGNPYGTPARPRRTIPTALRAGAVVELHGTYDVAHQSPRTIVSAGTAAAPVFIRGVSAKARPVATGCWEVSGSYFIVENIEFAGCGNIIIRSRTDHGVLRHADVHGTPAGGGVGVVSWDEKTVSDVVVWDNTIHDNGDVHASYDQDVHGIAVSARVSRLWVVDNQLYRNSGDGIQINAGSAALQPTTNHIYVGRNTSYENKQYGFWTKQAVDVIFSQNQSFRHRPSNSSMGACMGAQYATEYVWFIDNMMWDCDYGIQIASDSNGIGRHQFVIGNIITRIHDSNGDFQPTSAWTNCAISLPGGTNRYVMQNTIYDADSGICVPYANGPVYLHDNLVQRVRQDGSHLIFDSRAGLQLVESSAGNLFAPDLRVTVAGDTTRALASMALEPNGNNVVSDIGWLDPEAADFRLAPGSPAIDAGTMAGLGVWEHFQERYGVPLSVDAYNVSRNAEGPPDSGAVERVSTTAAVLNAAVSGSVVQLAWSPASREGARGYVIEAGSAPGLSDIASIPIASTATSFSASVPNGTYHVRVRPLYADGPGAASNEALVVVGCVTPPATPTGLSVGLQGARVLLGWQASSGGTARYRIEAGSGPGLTNIATIDVPGTERTFGVNAPPGRYFVRARAVNDCGRSQPSSEIFFTVGSPAPIPPVPTGLAARVAGSTVTLDWTPPPGPIAGYVLEAGSASGLANLASFRLGATPTLTVTAVPPGSYFVRVRGVTQAGTGGPSGEIVVHVPAAGRSSTH